MLQCENKYGYYGVEKHHTTSAEAYSKPVRDMLEKGSLNTYMFIGGTNFGFTSGANHYEKYAPNVSKTLLLCSAVSLVVDTAGTFLAAFDFRSWRFFCKRFYKT